MRAKAKAMSPNKMSEQRRKYKNAKNGEEI
jgi:hypothetical protein